jgi:hypothetical protein
MFVKMFRALKSTVVRQDKSSLESGNKKFAFVHIPKTAGMTMSAILERKFLKNEICPIRLYPDLLAMPKEEINKYRVFRGHFPYEILGCLLDEPFRCITILREPVARYYSYYKFMKNREDFEKFSFLAKEVPLIRKMDFKEFANATNLSVVKDGLNQQCRYLGKEIPETVALPYLAGKKDPTPDEIERAKTRLSTMDAFGLAERFQDSLFLMSFAFGWEPIMDNLVLNASGRSERSEITEDVKAFIEEKNKADVELFQFAKALFETKYQEMISTLVTQYGKKVGIQASPNMPPENIFKLLEQHANSQKKQRKI